MQGNLIDRNWFIFGAVCAPAILGLLAVSPASLGIPRRTLSLSAPLDPRAAAWAALAAYQLHQAEEYGTDFPAAMCRTLGLDAPPRCPIPASFFTAVNVGSVWGSAAIAIVLAPRNPRIALSVYGVAAVNAVAHTAGAFRGLISIGTSAMYNPGLVTSLLIFFPASLYVIRRFLAEGLVSRSDAAVLILGGILVHAVLLGSVVLYLRGTYGELALGAIQLLNGLVFLALFTAKGWVRSGAVVRKDY
ncbi:hypothetical protein DFJ74DRAFT_694394 [Hyaloraphidium curvatum]|nr:hypothetical protein DFJ74DRAFT_694394 [Hyaloraphidium curvatum]